MRPALKSYVYFDRHPEGVLFRSGAVAFVLKGSGIYPIVARLLNLLDGRHDRDTIAANLPEKVRPLYGLLLDELGKRDFVVDRGESDPSASGLESEFATPIAYLSDHGPGAMSRFEAWHRRALALGGSGRVFDSLVEALLELGAGNLYLVRDGDADGSDRLADAITKARARATPQRVTVLAAGERPPAPVDAALYASDGLDEDRIDAFGRIAPPTLVAGDLDGRILVAPGPATIAFGELRRRFNSDPATAAVPPAAGPLALAGNLLAFEWFRLDTGVAPRGYEDRAKLVSADMAVRDVPLDPARFAAREKPAEHPERELTEFEALLERLKPLFDEATGIFATGSGEKLNQLPLYHHEITLRSGGAPVRGWGLGVEDAARRAIARAAERHVLARAEESGGAVARAASSPEAAMAQLALTTAWLDDEARAAAARTPIDFAEVEGEALVLWRLAQAMGSPDLAAVRLEWPDRPGAVVAAETGGATVAWGAGADWREALGEALGNRCSALQLGEEPAPEPLPGGAFREPRLETGTALSDFGIHVACAARNVG